MNHYPQSGDDYCARLNAQTQAEAMRGVNRMQQSIQEHAAKAEISVQKEAQIARIREDVRREAECMGDAVSIGPNGEVFFERKFFRRCPEQFEILSVRLREILVFEPASINESFQKILVLGYSKGIGREEINYLYLSEFENIRYVNKKLRSVGIVFRCPERKREALLGDFLKNCLDLAQPRKIPVGRGFYWDEGILCYADDNTMIWQEVMCKC